MACVNEIKIVKLLYISKEGSERVTTSEKMNLILARSGHTKKWLAERWGISQPSISQKFKENNWKEADIKKFCEILGCTYNILFQYENETL